MEVVMVEKGGGFEDEEEKEVGGDEKIESIEDI